MKMTYIENNIVIDDIAAVVKEIERISGKRIQDDQIIKKFITTEKATKYYIDSKCASKMQPDKGSIYLWLDSGYVDGYGNAIMVSLINDGCGQYSGHYTGTIDYLSNSIKSRYPRNCRDIDRNRQLFKNKYSSKISDRIQEHIENETDYYVNTFGVDDGETEFAKILGTLNIDFIEAEEDIVAEKVHSTSEDDERPEIDMTSSEKEITISLLLDKIDEMNAYIDELLRELKKTNEDKLKLKEYETRTHELEQTIVEIRNYNQLENSDEVEKSAIPESGHDLLGRRGKILVLGASALDVKTMSGIAKVYGFKKEDFEYETDYEKVISFAGRSSNFAKYSAIILGACPHKVQNLGDWSSLIEKCRNTEAFPVAVDARSKSGKLKVTKDSFRRAIMEVCSELKITNA